MTVWYFDGQAPCGLPTRSQGVMPTEGEQIMTLPGGGGGRIMTLPGGGGGRTVTAPGGGGGRIMTLPGGGGSRIMGR